MNATFSIHDPCSKEPRELSAELPVTIGRGPDADIQLRDRWVSSRHCCVEEVDGKMQVRDLGSRYGTMVNRKTIKNESPLPAGAELLVGLTSVRCVLKGNR